MKQLESLLSFLRILGGIYIGDDARIYCGAYFRANGIFIKLFDSPMSLRKNI